MFLDRWLTALRSRSFNFTGTALASIGVVAVMLTSWMVTTSSPRSEVQVRLSDGAVWLPSQALGGVSLLDGGSGSIATSLGVAENNDDFEVVQWGSDAIIVNTTDGTVSRLDGSAWSITTGRVQFSKPGEAMSVVAGHEVGWLVKTGSVSPLDLESLAQRDPLPVGSEFADGLVTESGNLLYASSDPSTPVREFHIDGSSPTDLADLSGPTALANLGSTEAAVDLDDHSVWLASDGQVCDRLEVAPSASLQAGGADDHLFVISDDGGAFLWNPRQSGCPGNDDFLTLGASTYGRPVLTFGWAVVQDIDSGEVIVVDFDALGDVKRRSIEGVDPGTKVQLVAENGAVWYNDPQSSRAGLIHRDGTIEPISKYDENSGGGFVAAPLSDTQADDVAVAGAQVTPDSELSEAATEQAAAEGSPTTTTPAGDDRNTPATQPDPDDTTPAVTTPGTPSTEPGGEPQGETGETTSTTDPDGSTTSTTENTAPLVIQIGASATQVVAGNTLQFTAITVKGKPNFWELQVSPNSGKQATFRTFGTFEYTFYDPGQYSVAVRTCDADNNCVRPVISVTVVDNPDLIPLEASFTGPADAEVSSDVTFQSTSQGDPASYRWTFPGGSPDFSVSPNGTTSWSEPGTKTVTLEITRGSETDTITRDITILRTAPGGDDSPFALNCTPSSMATGETATCSLVGDPADFWDLAFTSVVPNPAQATRGASGAASYTVSSGVEGTVTVTLTGRDKVSGNDRSDSFSINVADNVVTVLPSGSVSGPDSVEAGTTATYTASGSNIASWSWSGQGSPTFNNPNGESTTVRWNNPGTYRLDVVLTGSGSTTISKTVTVTNPSPTFAFNPTCAPATRPADGTSAATCRLADGNHAEFTGLSYNVSNPSGLDLNRWGSPGETYIASHEPGQLTVTVTGTHTATGTAVSGGPFTLTYQASGTTTTTVAASPFGMSCSSYSVPANGSDVAWCTLDGDTNDFTGLTYTIGAPNPGSLNAWGDYRGYNVAYAEPGNVNVTLSGTDAATGNPVSASRTVTFVAEATTTTTTAPTTTTESTTTTTAAPQPATLTITCTGSTSAGSVASCSLTADPAKFSGYSWSANPQDPSQLQWWPAGTESSFQYDAPGTVGVTLSATDVATGQPVSASRTVTFN